MKNKITFLILFIVLCFSSLQAQVTQEWAQRYNGPGNSSDGAYSIAVDHSGNIYVTGFSTGSGTGYDYATIKYNSSGAQQWVQIYGPGNGDDFALSLAVDGSGNIYVTGYSTGSGTGEDYATIKYNSSCDSLWVTRYNGLGSNSASSIAVDASGNVYVTGLSNGVGSSDYATIKYNSSGDSLWVARYNGPGNGNDNASSIAIDDSGNVYVTGSSGTIKYNSSGVQQWVQIYGGYFSSLTVDGSGNVYVTGIIVSGTTSDYVTIKYNSSGVQQWVQRYNGPGNNDDGANSIAVDGSGNDYVTGFSIGSGNSDYATIKYSQLTGVSQTSNTIPENFSLSQNYPNPFNPNTVISYQLAVNSVASLKIYDVLGNEVEL